MGFRASFREIFSIANTLSGDYAGAGKVVAPVLDELWTNGADDYEAHVAWSDLGVTLADSTTRSLDLTALTILGSSITLVEVRAILFRSRDYTLSVGKGATNGWDGLGSAWTFDAHPGTYARHFAPLDGTWTTVSGTKKTIDITNASGSTATYDVVIVGTVS